MVLEWAKEIWMYHSHSQGMAPEKAELSIQDIDLWGHLVDCSLSIWDIISFRACLKGRESSNNAWVISKLYLLFFFGIFLHELCRPDWLFPTHAPEQDKL